MFTEDHFGVVAHVNRAVQERLGVDVTVLRCAAYRADPDCIFCVYVMETHSEAVPHEGRWIARERLAALPLTRAEERSYLDQWLIETEPGEDEWNRVPLIRSAYNRPGWYDRVLDWAVPVLERYRG